MTHTSTRIAEVLWANITEDMATAQRSGAQGIVMKQFVAARIIPRLARALEDFASSQQPRDMNDIALAETTLLALERLKLNKLLNLTEARTPQSVVLDAFASVRKVEQNKHARQIGAMLATMFLAAEKLQKMARDLQFHDERGTNVLIEMRALESTLRQYAKEGWHERITDSKDERDETPSARQQ